MTKGKVKQFNDPKKYKKVVKTLRYKNSPYTARTILKTTPLTVYPLTPGSPYTCIVNGEMYCTYGG